MACPAITIRAEVPKNFHPQHRLVVAIVGAAGANPIAVGRHQYRLDLAVQRAVHLRNPNKAARLSRFVIKASP